MEQPDYHAWRKQFAAARGRPPTPYEAWIAARGGQASSEPVAVVRYERGAPGRENDMPRVVSCNRLPDGEYPLYAAPQQAPLTQEQVREVVKKAGFDHPKASYAEQAAFISGLRHGEVARGITAAKEST